MKIKEKTITKLQQGGWVPPFQPFNYMSFGGQPEQSQSGTRGNSKNDDDFDIGDYISKMKGLPSDIKAFTEQARNVIASPFGKTTINKNSMEYFELMSQLTMVNSYKELYEKALTNAVNNKALNEYALTSSGGMIVYNNEGKLNMIGISDYDPSKFRAATVGDLVKERANNENFAFNQELIDIISSSVGRETIITKIDNRLKEIKTSDVTNKDLSILQRGIAILENQNSTDISGLTSGTLSTSEKINAYDKQTAKYALDTLYGGLTQQEKLVLELIGFETSDKDEDGNIIRKSGKDVILDIINSRYHTSTVIEKNYKEFDEDEDGSGKSSKSGSTKDYPDTQAIALWQDRFGVPSTTSIRLGSNIFDVTSWKHNTITGIDEKPLTQGTVSDFLNKSQVGEILDQDQMYFGDYKLTTIDTDVLVFDITKGMKSMYLPVNQNEELDLEVFRKIKTVEDTIKRKYGDKPTDLQIRQEYNSEELLNYIDYREANSKVDSEKDLDIQYKNLRKFVAIEAFGPIQDGSNLKSHLDNKGNEYIGLLDRSWINEGNENFEPIANYENSYIQTFINRAGNTENARKNGKKHAEDLLDGGWWGVENDLAVGTVFIKVSDDPSPALRRSGIIRYPGRTTQQAETDITNTTITSRNVKTHFE